MNFFNRALIIILCIVFILFWAAVIVAFILFPSQTAATISAAANFLQDNMTLYVRIMFSLLAAAFILVSLLLLLSEITPQATTDIPLPQVSGGDATLTTDAIIQRIKYETEALPQVHQIKPTVVVKGRAVDVHLELLTDPDVEVAPTTEEVIQVVRDSVKSKMGIDLRRVTVQIRHEPISREKAAPTKRVAPAANEGLISEEADISSETKPKIVVPDATLAEKEPSAAELSETEEKTSNDSLGSDREEDSQPPT